MTISSSPSFLTNYSEPFHAGALLEESFRLDLMQKAKVEFDMGNPAHRLYVTIFELMPKANVYQINDLLKAEGFTPWTRDREDKKRYAKKSM